MNRKLSSEDKAYLHTISRNKGWEVGCYLMAYGVRGDVFDQIMAGSQDVSYERPKQRQEWLAQVMQRMDALLPPDKVKEMREGSACCLGGERALLAKQIHDAYDTVDERFAQFAKTQRIVGDRAYQVDQTRYRICFWEHPPEKGSCSCLKYVPRKEPMSKSWCYCCGGHIKTHFENALGVKATCDCVSSQLSSCGREPCLFELTIIAYPEEKRAAARPAEVFRPQAIEMELSEK